MLNLILCLTGLRMDFTAVALLKCESGGVRAFVAVPRESALIRKVFRHRGSIGRHCILSTAALQAGLFGLLSYALHVPIVPTST